MSVKHRRGVPEGLLYDESALIRSLLTSTNDASHQEKSIAQP